MEALWMLPFCPSSQQGSIIHGCVSSMSPLQRTGIKYLPRIISSSRRALPAPLGELGMQESQMRPASVTAVPRRSLTIHHPGDRSHKSAAVTAAGSVVRATARFTGPRARPGLFPDAVAELSDSRHIPGSSDEPQRGLRSLNGGSRYESAAGGFRNF